MADKIDLTENIPVMSVGGETGGVVDGTAGVEPAVGAAGAEIGDFGLGEMVAGQVWWMWVALGVLVVGLGVLAYFQWEQIMEVLSFGGAGVKVSAEEEKIAKESESAYLQDAMRFAGGKGKKEGYPCELGRDADGRPVIVRVAKRDLCK